MVKWRLANFAVIGSLIVGSGLLIVMSPGWQAVLAQAGCYGYGASTTLWLNSSKVWTNGAGFLGKTYSYSSVISHTVDGVCGGSGSRGHTYRPDGPYLDITCAPSGGGTLWVVNGRWTNGQESYGPGPTDQVAIEATSEAFCATNSQTVAAKTSRAGPYLDVLCNASS